MEQDKDTYIYYSILMGEMVSLTIPSANCIKTAQQKLEKTNINENQIGYGTLNSYLNQTYSYLLSKGSISTEQIRFIASLNIYIKNKYDVLDINIWLLDNNIKVSSYFAELSERAGDKIDIGNIT